MPLYVPMDKANMHSPCSNRVNDSYACANSKIMNGLLKTELGFQGLVVSDWDGQHTGVASANAGLDLAMPNSPYWQNLTMAVNNGSFTEARLDDMATRYAVTLGSRRSLLTTEI